MVGARAPDHRGVEDPEAEVGLSPKPSRLEARSEAPRLLPKAMVDAQPLPRCDPRRSQPLAVLGPPRRFCRAPLVASLRGPPRPHLPAAPYLSGEA